MSKYQYHQVESLSDLDLTFETRYYRFEDGIGHKEVKFLQVITLTEIQSMIDDKVLYTRTKTPWYENIPKHGVLCRNDWATDVITLILSYDKEGDSVYDVRDRRHASHSMTPLTNDEIKQFLREED